MQDVFHQQYLTNSHRIHHLPTNFLPQKVQPSRAGKYTIVQWILYRNKLTKHVYRGYRYILYTNQTYVYRHVGFRSLPNTFQFQVHLQVEDITTPKLPSVEGWKILENENPEAFFGPKKKPRKPKFWYPGNQEGKWCETVHHLGDRNRGPKNNPCMIRDSSCSVGDGDFRRPKKGINMYDGHVIFVAC